MAVYAKKVQTTDPRFQDRAIMIASPGIPTTTIPVPDSEVICNGCNANIAETEEKEGYLVYLGKRELDKDQPYDFYCYRCTRTYFPKAQYIS